MIVKLDMFINKLIRR